VKQHKKITVKGIVQGVGFRYACLQFARGIGIKGFVKNQYDGTVYIEAEGTEIQIKHFIKWCWNGSSHASVSDVYVNDGAIKDFSHFDIKNY
jgi:acylphosphatase